MAPVTRAKGPKSLAQGQIGGPKIIPFGRTLPAAVDYWADCVPLAVLPTPDAKVRELPVVEEAGRDDKEWSAAAL